MSTVGNAGSIHLLVELIKRDFRSRFTGSALGISWAILQPLSFVVLYWFVFTRMIPRSPDAGSVEYPLFLISGLLPWLGISEGISRATPAIVENGPMVRRLTFKSEILIIVPIASAIIFELIGILLFIGYLVFLGQDLRSLWVLPFAIGLQFLLQTGIGWFLATIHVFFRDVTQILGFVLTIGLYLSPILYSGQGRYAIIFAWNPMTPLLGLFRSAMLATPLPGAGSFVYLLTVTAVLWFGGLTFFKRAQPTLADLI